MQEHERGCLRVPCLPVEEIEPVDVSGAMGLDHKGLLTVERVMTSYAGAAESSGTARNLSMDHQGLD